MDSIYRLPRTLIQAVGLACVPCHDMAEAGAYARRPVAAGVVTLTQREDGHVDCIGVRVTDARPQEFPLPWMIEGTLMPGALALVSADDRETLGAEVMARRFFVEPRLAKLVRGEEVADPTATVLVATAPAHSDGNGQADAEAQLCRRLSIPVMAMSDAEVERLWLAGAIQAVEEVALAHAVSRMMLWAHTAALAAGEPGPMFETLGALRGFMDGEQASSPTIYAWGTSRPMMRAASFASNWREHRRAGNGDAPGWASFEDGLFYT